MDICIFYEAVHLQYKMLFFHVLIDTCKSFNVGKLYIIPKTVVTDVPPSEIEINFINSLNELPENKLLICYESRETLLKNNIKPNFIVPDENSILLFGGDSFNDNFVNEIIKSKLSVVWKYIFTPNDNKLWSFIAAAIALSDSQ